MVPLAAVALAAGILLLASGLRGRRADDHPVCRHCGRDLTGVESARCPECGRPADHPRIGNRRRLPTLAAAGALLAVAGLAPLVLLAAAAFSDVGNQPLWMLLWRDDAVAVLEVDRRARDGELTKERQAKLVARFLDDQDDLSREWVPEKGTFLLRYTHRFMNGRGRAAMSAQQEQRYVEQAVRPFFRVRPVVRSGQPLSYVRNDPRLRVHASDNHAGVLIVAVVLRDGEPVFRDGIRFEDGLHGSPFREIDLDRHPPLPPGTYGVGVEPDPWRGPRRPDTAPFAGRPLATFEVVPADATLTRLVEDEALRRQVEAAATFKASDAHDDLRQAKEDLARAEWTQRTGRGWSEWDLRLIDGDVTFDPPLTPPVALAYELVARADDGREFVAERGDAAPAGEAVARLRRGRSVLVPADLPDDRLTLLLRPSAAAAEERMDVEAILAGEVVLRRAPRP